MSAEVLGGATVSIYAITLAILGTTAEVVLLGIVSRRGVARGVPAFIAYLYWLILSDLALYAALALNCYAKAFRIEMFCDGLVLFVVLFGLAHSVLRPLPKLGSRCILVLMFAIVAGAAPIIWRFSESWSSDGWSATWHSLMRMQMTLALLRILFLVLMGVVIQFLANHFLPIGWGERELQIATGIGLYALASLAGSLLQTYHWSAKIQIEISEGVSSTFFLVLVYWIIAFLRPAIEPSGSNLESDLSSGGTSAPSSLWKDQSPVTSGLHQAGTI